MVSSAMFIISKTKLLPALEQLNSLQKGAHKRKITLEITLLQNCILLVIPGVELNVQAETNGSAKASILLWYITDIVTCQKEDILVFSVFKNSIELNGMVFRAMTTLIENDQILRSIKLPINFTLIDIAKLYLSEKYTSDEIEFNNLNENVNLAFKVIMRDLGKSTQLLAKYNITKGDLEDLVYKKLTSE